VGRRTARPAVPDLAWVVPLLAFMAWQLVLRQVTGSAILLASAASNSSAGIPFGQFTDALWMNLGVLWPPTGAA
jgi:hypothetical protein